MARTAIDKLAGKFDLGDGTGLKKKVAAGLSNWTNTLISNVEAARGTPRPYLDEDPVRDSFVESNSSFSGVDGTLIAQVNQHMYSLGNVETFSYSIFREKGPVRVLGRTYAKGYTGGPRSIAGSIVFIVFDRNPLWDLLVNLKHEPKTTTDRYTTPVTDQLPPIDLALWCANEYGHKSVLRLYGVEFMQEGQVHSVNDIYTENTAQYIARDIDVLTNYKDIEGFRNLLYERQVGGLFTDNMLGSMLEYRKKIEKRIQDEDILIQQIQQERGKRGMVTFGLSERFGNKDLKVEYDKHLKIKQTLVEELQSIANQIVIYQQNLYGGWNPQQSSATGMAQYDNLAARDTTSASNYKPTSNEDTGWSKFAADTNAGLEAIRRAQ